MIGRRTFSASVLAASLAGCLGNGANGDGTSGDSDGGSEIEDHPSLVAADGIPQLGPQPTDAEAVVVAFDDPSCSSCATFAAETFPQLRDGPIENGRVSYLSRLLPWVEPDWSRPAINALYAVHEADQESFWELKNRYYDAQNELDEGSVREWTEAEIETLSVDAESVLESMEDDRYDDRIDAAETSAEGSDVTVVPSFVLFSDGEYVTTVIGPQSYDVFEGALDL